ncbi:SRPBCC family protein [Nocardioides sp. ChNu-153]|uniref:SRPBCC family protein n=1 Tax=unclassified Nocardioides TaxID=2615069 RepID=UPI0024058A15|nr:MULTISPECIES: SRPBCC family protein [unclassified Nocardioides]MDF9716959.1 SRPBCC family protein [Nocardioides sp. ChNu-99]MDN7122664.1 SRPBCC family protein [Nocardioides sp. ChNu-153]
MSRVTASAETTVAAPPEAVLAALADYRETRPAILTEHYTDYAVTEGGTGAGTVASWRLHATKKRVRHVVADVETTADTVVEKDRNSTLVTTFRVTPAGDGSAVVATTTWEGASGVGGFFERTFAPAGLKRIHGELLANLDARLRSA